MTVAISTGSTRFGVLSGISHEDRVISAYVFSQIQPKVASEAAAELQKKVARHFRNNDWALAAGCVDLYASET